MIVDENPLVTVCLTTYNRMQLLPKAVSTVLQQSYATFELIIVDDCSSDYTEKIVETLLKQDERIRYIRHEINKGLAAARNTAIFNAKGKYFTFIDDDDQWAPNYIEEFIKEAEHYDDNWCFCCGSLTIDLLGQSVYGMYPSLHGKLLDYIKMGYTPPITSQFYFTCKLTEVGGYNENIKSGVDHDLWFTLAFKGVNIKSIEKYLSLPAEVFDVSRDKMTNVYLKRIQGITNSLAIWRKGIVDHFGEAYFERYHYAYILREKKKFFRLYLLKFNFLEAYKLYKEINSEIKAKEIAKTILIVILRRFRLKIKRSKYITRNPVFAPYLRLCISSKEVLVR